MEAKKYNLIPCRTRNCKCRLHSIIYENITNESAIHINTLIAGDVTSCKWIKYDNSIEHQIFVKDRCDIIELLFSLHHDVNVDAGVMVATKHGYVDLLKLLLNKYPDFKIRIHNDYFLKRAACYGKVDVVKYLVEECNMDSWDNAIVDAFHNGQVSVIEYLSRHYDLNPEISEINYCNKTSNDYYKRQEYKTKCSLCKSDDYHFSSGYVEFNNIDTKMMGHYIDAHIKNGARQGLFDRAIETNNNELAFMLWGYVKYPITLSKKSMENMISYGNMEMVEYMITHSVTIPDVTDLNVAIHDDNIHVIKYLKNNYHMTDRMIKFVASIGCLYLYGGFVRDHMYKKVNYGQNNEFNDFDIWIKTNKEVGLHNEDHIEMTTIIDKFVKFMSHYNPTKVDRGTIYPHPVERYSITYNGKIKYVDFVLSKLIPVNDFNVNTLTYDGMSFGSWTPRCHKLAKMCEHDEVTDIPMTVREIGDCILDKVCYVFPDFYNESENSWVAACQISCKARIEDFKNRGWKIKRVQKVIVVKDL